MFAASKERFERKLKEESKVEGKRETLERQLRRRFGEHIPDAEIRTVRECSDIDKLDAALDAILTAEQPNEVISQLR